MRLSCDDSWRRSWREQHLLARTTATAITAAPTAITTIASANDRDLAALRRPQWSRQSKPPSLDAGLARRVDLVVSRARVEIAPLRLR